MKEVSALAASANQAVCRCFGVFLGEERSPDLLGSQTVWLMAVVTNLTRELVACGIKHSPDVGSTPNKRSVSVNH